MIQGELDVLKDWCYEAVSHTAAAVYCFYFEYSIFTGYTTT